MRGLEPPPIGLGNPDSSRLSYIAYCYEKGLIGLGATPTSGFDRPSMNAIGASSLNPCKDLKREPDIPFCLVGLLSPPPIKKVAGLTRCYGTLW